MKNGPFINASNLKTGEQAVTGLILSMLSLKSLLNFQLEAYKKGLLNEEEEEVGKTILWELQRLLELYKKQAELLGSRFPIDETEFYESLEALGKPKRRKKA